MKKTLPAIVVAAHLFFLLFLTKAIHIKEKKKKDEKVVVHFVEEPKATIVESPSCPPIASEPPPLPQPSVEEKEEEAPIPEPKKVESPKKKVPPEKPKPKEIRPTPKPKAKPSKKSPSKAKLKAPKKENPNNKKLASLMQESLELLEKTSPSKKGSQKVSKKIHSLGIEGLKSEKEEVASYESEIAHYLKKKLKLLEPGIVKIKLKLASNGKVESLTILSGDSDKNKEVVENKIPTITFPPFDSRLEGEKSHTFHITLKSDF